MLKEKFFTLYRNRLVRALFIALLSCFLYSAWLSDLGPIVSARLKITDMLFAMNHSLRPSATDSDIAVVIAIDDESIRKSNMRWPWPRRVIADAIKKIKKNDPAIICVDIIFFGKSKPRDDNALADILEDADNVLTAAYFGSDGGYVAPEDSIASDSQSYGFTNKPLDPDNTVRRMKPATFLPNGEIAAYALPVKVASRYKDVSDEETFGRIRRLPDNTAYVYFSKRAREITAIPIFRVLNDEVDLDMLKGKIVFIGVTSSAIHDIHLTPLGIMPGVFVVLNEALTFVFDKSFLYASPWINFIILFVSVFLACFTAFSFPAARSIVSTILEIAFFSLLVSLLFLFRIVIDPFGPIFLITLVSTVLHSNRYALLVFENINLRREAVTDGLTGLFAFRYMELRMQMDLKKARGARHPLSVVLYDLDKFKPLNDTYGHEFGNRVIKDFSKILKDNHRRSDTVARYGGEEFCVIMPDTRMKQAVRSAETVLQKMREKYFETTGGKLVTVTVSAGVASTENCRFENHTELLKAADTALYRSKEEGRDRTTSFY